jgi:hypothetical protein
MRKVAEGIDLLHPPPKTSLVLRAAKPEDEDDSEEDVE